MTAPCLVLVGGNDDNLDCGALNPPVMTLPLTPAWFAHIKFIDLLAPNGTLSLLAELESVWTPRWLPSQRSAGGGIARWAMLMLRTMPSEEQVIITACTEMEQGEQFMSLTSTLLPTAPRLATYAPSSAAAALALSRTLARATSKEGPLSISVHEILVVIPHFAFARLAIGTEMGAPTALGELLELVRAALKSNTAVLTLGSISAAAEVFQYLLARLTALHELHSPHAERIAFLHRELTDRRAHEFTSRGSSGGGGADAGAGGAGGGAGGGGGAAGGHGYAPMYVGALCDILASPEFVAICEELALNFDAHVAPGVSIERILAYRGVGAAILHHVLRGYVGAVRDLPIASRIATELRPHGPQWVADALAELSLPPETDAAPRIIPTPMPELWSMLCKSQFGKINLEDAIYNILAQCGGHDGYVKVPDTLQFSSIERLRRTERTIVPFFAKFGYISGDLQSLDTLYATVYAYYDDATAVPLVTRNAFIRSVLEAVHRESGAREAALLGARKPDESLPTTYVIPHSGGVTRLQRLRLEAPTAVTMSRALSTLLGPAKAKSLGLGARLVPEGMQPGAVAAVGTIAPAAGTVTTAGADADAKAKAAEAEAAAKAKREAKAAEEAVARAERERTVELGSGVRQCIDFASRPGHLGIGREGDKRRWVELEKFYATPGVPAPPEAGKIPPLTDPGPNCCPAVWCSRSEGYQEAFCTAVGKPGHGRGGKAHQPPAGWRKKYLGGLLALAAATGDAARATAPPPARSALPSCFAGAPVAPPPRAVGATPATFALPSLGPLADLPEPAYASAAPSALAVARFEAHGGHAFAPIWYPSPSAPHVALPDASGRALYGSDDAAVLALRGGASREAALASAGASTAALFGEERADLVCFGFFRDADAGGGEVAGFVASQPPPSDAPARRYATLREAAASGARGPLWLPVSALRDTPLARLTRLVAARVRSFVEPAADFTLLGAAVGALAPRPVAPARVALPVACAAARLTPDEVRARSSRAVSALQQEFRLALAHGGYDEADRAYLGTWLGKIEPPEFGEMPRGLLEQATVPTDPLIRHVPYPAYCRGVTSAALPPLPPPPGPLAVPVWATAWRHSLVPEAAALVCSWLRLLRDGLRRFAAGEPGERVARDMPPALAIGVTNFSPWAADVARRGDVLVRRGGKFELLDLSQPPAAYRAGTGLNRAFLAELLAENGSEDFALRDMLLTHGAVYLADLAPVLLLQPPLRSFFASASGFSSAHTETARMAKMEWFEVHLCARLDDGDFELPCLPFRANPSGAAPRKLEPDRWRGVQDFGGPRRPLRELPFVGGMGSKAAHVLAFGPALARRALAAAPSAAAVPRGVSCGGVAGCLLAAVPAALPGLSARPPPSAARLPRHLGHYFSGTSGLVGRAAHAARWSAREVDVESGTDLSAPATVRAELARVARGDFGALALGPPCSTFSPNLAEGGGRYVLRDWERPDGRPVLSSRLRAKLDLHNGFIKFTADAALLQLRAGGELLIENSAGRYDARSPAYWPAKAHMPPMWATSPMQRLMFLAATMGRPLSLLRAPQCAFGRGPHGLLFQKWTEFLATPDTARRLARFNELRCTCPPGAHSLARGLDADGVPQAALAAAYPELLCRCIVYGLTGAGERPAILGCVACSEASPSARAPADSPHVAAAPTPLGTVAPSRPREARAPRPVVPLARRVIARREGDAAAAARTLVAAAPAPERALVYSLNSASGIRQSRAARVAYAALLRPGSAGANPRFTPALRREAELPGPRDTFPAALAEPASLASTSWAGGRWDWPQEFKPFFSDLLLSIVVVGHLAHLCGMDVYVLTDDCKDWFHQFCLATLQCWACGMFRLDPGAHELGDPEAALAVVLARCLEMGVSPSSNIAQRALTEILTSLSARFAASEEPHLLLLERRFPAFREARAARRALSERTGRDEARCHALLGYTDDVAAVLMGAAATVRYCAAHGRHLGPGGCNVTMAIPAKRTLGISVPFIGATALTVGQLAYISREKVHRTQLALASARDGSLALAEWVKLAGLLNHLVCVLLMPYYVMYGVYECLDDARTRGLGQDAHVEPTKGGLKALRRWSDALTTTAGTTALAALYPSRRPAGAGVLHVMHSDAAKEGTGAPAICGNLYSEIWVLPLRDEWRALPIVATEFVGGIINIMIFAPMLHGAPGLLVLDALVVPTVIAGKASSPLMRYLHEYLVALPEYALVSDTLLVAQEYGPYNPIADAGSRGKGAALESLMGHMGLRASYHEPPPRAVALLDSAAALWQRMSPGERAAHMQLELVGAREQPGLGSTSMGAHNIAMDGRPVAHPGVACGGLIGCAALLTLAVTPPGAPPGVPAASAASAASAADGAARCLLAADSVAQRECASRVAAAAARSLQREAASSAAAALLPAPASAAAAPGARTDIPGDPGAFLGPPSARRAARRPCNDCDGCLRPDCGGCAPCRDKPKFGGVNRLRRRCVARVCTGNVAGPATPASAAPASAAVPPIAAAPAAALAHARRRKAARLEARGAAASASDASPHGAPPPSPPSSPPFPASPRARAAPLPFPSVLGVRRSLPALATRTGPPSSASQALGRWSTPAAPRRYVYGRAAPLSLPPLRGAAPPSGAGRSYRALPPPPPPSSTGPAQVVGASRQGVAVRAAAGLHVAGADADPGQPGTGPARLSALLSRAYAPLTNKHDAGHWRAWERACALLGTSPWRTDVAANSGADPVGYEEEVYLVCMALILMYSWMKPRSRADPAADPRSAVKKLQAVRRIHRQRWPPIEMVPMSAVANVLKGMMREYIDTHGFRSLVPRRKLPLTNSLINGMLGVYEGARRGALVVARESYYWQAMLCLFVVASETAIRKAEGTGNQGRNGLTFASLTYKVRGTLYKIITRALLAVMGVGDGVYLAHGVAKNDPLGSFFAATPSYLPWRAVGRCACRELAALDLAAAVAPGAREATPLFGPAAGEFFTEAQVEAAFVLCLAEGARVPAEELSNYSFHSFRIFVACALLSAGAPRWLIKRMCRWRGDESLEIYARVSDQEWEQRLSSVLDATVDATLVPRLPRMDVSPEQESDFLAMAHSLLGANFNADRASA